MARRMTKGNSKSKRNARKGTRKQRGGFSFPSFLSPKPVDNSPKIDVNDPLILDLVKMLNDPVRRNDPTYKYKDIEDLFFDLKMSHNHKGIIERATPELSPLKLLSRCSPNSPNCLKILSGIYWKKYPEARATLSDPSMIPNYIFKKIIENGAYTMEKLNTRKEALRKLVDERVTK